MNTNISIYEIFAILLMHWIADFILQTDWQAQNKSKNNWALTQHVIFYSFQWLVFSVIVGGLNKNVMLMVLFMPITFICHWITDYFTSRLNSKLWKEGKVHWFFISIGFDQMLHYVQLIITWQLLK